MLEISRMLKPFIINWSILIETLQKEKQRAVHSKDRQGFLFICENYESFYYYHFSYASINSILSTSTTFISFDGCLEMCLLMMCYSFPYIYQHLQHQHIINKTILFVTILLKKKYDSHVPGLKSIFEFR